MSKATAKRRARVPFEKKVTYVPRVANDKRSFGIFLETNYAATYYEFLCLSLGWIDQELKDMGRKPEDPTQ